MNLLTALLVPAGGLATAAGVLLGGRVGKALVGVGAVLFGVAVVLVLIQA